MNDRTDWTAWDWLKAATKAGWEDPGETEPLEVTVKRAKEFLERTADRDSADSASTDTNAGDNRVRVQEGGE